MDGDRPDEGQPQSKRPLRRPAGRRVVGGLARVIAVLLAVTYPLFIYVGLRYWSARQVALWVLAFALPAAAWRLRQADASTRVAVLSAPAAVAVLVGLAAWLDDPRLILALPVLVNLALLLTFAATLTQQTSMVERYARLVKSDLSKAEMKYCRSVTVVWCGFFVLNGAAAAALALWAPVSWWAAYTGLISYGLMGTLFAAEYVVRRTRFGGHGTGLLDRFLSRILPSRTNAEDERP